MSRDTTNAATELKSILGENKVKCARVTFGDESWEGSEVKVLELPVNHSRQDLDGFFKKLNRTYDSGYGGQRLFGFVWLADGTWLERGEYDGSGWWEHKVCPKIPEHLR